MYPDLSYLFNDLLGTPVDNWLSAFKTFGMLLAIAFLFAGWVVRSELKRREESGELSPITKTVEVTGGVRWKEIIYNALTLGFIALKLPFILNNFPLFQADPAAVIFSKLGNWPLGILVTALATGALYYLQSKNPETPGTRNLTIHPHEKTGDILIIAAISGVFGAKLFSILENLDSFFQDPLGQLFSGSGLTIYGGLIVAFFAVYWYIKKLGIPMRSMMDIAGMAILLGYGIGRLGCHFAGDGDWGITAAAQPSWWFLPDWLWSYNYPNNVNNDGGLLSICDPELFNKTHTQISIEQKCLESCGMRYCHELKQNVYPTSIWETLMSFGFFGLLWLWRKRVKVAGTLFFSYMILNGIERFFIEFIRVNDRYNYFGMNWSQAQYISIGFILIGIIGIIMLNRKDKDIT